MFRTNTTLYHWLYLLVALISVILMLWSARWGYAEILAITPRHNITQWETTTNTLDRQSAKESWGHLQKAVILNNNNAEFYMDLARLATLQANTAETSIQDQQQYQILAIHNLKKALSLRPTWGLAWAKLAQSYAADNSNSSDFIKALELAIHFEPYEELNQQLIIPLGIAQWNILPDSIKEKITIITKHALQHQPKIIHALITTTVQYNWSEHLSLLITHKWHKDLLNKAMREKENIVNP